MDVTAHAADVVRRLDRDRYLADLYAPADRRPHLFALHAFDAEAARIREAVSEPSLGEIRLQWWRDALAGAPDGHPVAEALTRTIAAHRLPSSAFDAYLSARMFDLYDDPMPDRNTLEGYAGETDGMMFQMAALIMGGAGARVAADASGHAGVALTVVRLLVRLARSPARWQHFVPVDLVRDRGASRADLMAARATPAVVAVLGDVRAMAREHLARAEAAVAALTTDLRPAYLPLAAAEPVLNRLERLGDRPFGTRTGASPLRRQWAIWRAARRR